MSESPSPQQSDGRPVVAIFRSPLFNASETFVQRQAMVLTRYRPVIVGLEDKGHVMPELADRVVLPSGPIDRGVIRLLGRVGALAERLRPEAPRLVHAHFATDAVLGLRLAEALGVPLVTTLHGYDVSRSDRRLLLSGRWSWMRYALARHRLTARGALFLAVSDALREQALSRGFPAERTLTHYLGIDLDHSGKSASEPGLILHVARLVEKKGTALLIEAVAALDGPRLVVIGDGPLRPALERRAAALGLGTRVTFLGALPPDQVAGWMRRAWLVAAPSVTAQDGDAEGLPTVILEAMAAALPVVGTNHGGIPEAIVDGETGFLVPERDVPALGARIGALLAEPALRDRMGAAARRRAEQKFDLRRQVARLETLYDGLLGQIRP